jgi:hypothetical protein
MTHRILFICKRRAPYGKGPYVSHGLINSARLVAEQLNRLPGVVAKYIDVHDNNAIDKEVTNFKPTAVVIEALWVVPSKFPVLVRLHPRVQWVVRVHSKPSFIANEGIAMEWLAAYAAMAPNVRVAANNEEFAETLSNLFGHRALYLPNVYSPVSRPNRRMDSGKYLHVGCFGAIRPMKNHLTQAMAAIEFARERGRFLVFHVNGDRLEQKGEEVIKNLRALFAATPNTVLLEHPWTSHEDFLGIAANMHIGMQVSLTETFNIVSADLASLGVPLVVCEDVDWAPWVCKAAPGSIDDILGTMDRVWALDRIGLIVSWTRFKLWLSNVAALRAWKRELLR